MFKECNSNGGVEIIGGVELSSLLSGVEFAINVPKCNWEDEVDSTLDFDNFLGVILDDSNEKRMYNSFAEVKNKMKDIRTDGKLKKYVLREGTGPHPTDLPVFVHYVSFVEGDETPFDTSYSRSKKPEMFKFGNGAVYEGFEVAIRSMKLGEISIFMIHPDLAFRSMGAPPRIPKNATICIEIELVGFGQQAEDTGEDKVQADKRSFPEVYKQIKALLLQSRVDFDNNTMGSIIANYKKAERILLTCRLRDDIEEKKWKNILLKVYVNLCVCYNHEKCSKPKLVCVTAREALQSIPEAAEKNPKLFFQLGKAKLVLNSLEEAYKCFSKAYTLKGEEDVEIKRYLELVERMQKQQADIEDLDKQVGFHL